MASTAEIFFVGLCSFLNIHDKEPHMPPPSVILHRFDEPKMQHAAYIAFDKTKVTMVDTGVNAKPLPQTDFEYIVLDGEELTLNDDWSSGPDATDASFKEIAHLKQYAKDNKMVWNKDRVAPKGKHPDEDDVAAFLEFGNGRITADWPTSIEWAFMHGGETSVQKRFNRRVRYGYDLPANKLIIIARAIDGSGKRKLIFEAKAGTNVPIWIGNSMNDNIARRMDLAGEEPQQFSNAVHFAAFYQSLADPDAKVFIPKPIVPPEEAGGNSSGYCGPDSQP